MIDYPGLYMMFGAFIWISAAGAIPVWFVNAVYLEKTKNDSVIWAFWGGFASCVVALAMLGVQHEMSRPPAPVPAVMDRAQYEVALNSCLLKIDIDNGYQRDFCVIEARRIATPLETKKDKTP